ncbi:uncharacterized protein DS421_13g410980 [Arachis hypogaea]|nr:uncharacterized protein DS421_13g410980 [Arachis hypogaea]
MLKKNQTFRTPQSLTPLPLSLSLLFRLSVLSPPAETELGAVVARGRSACFSILFYSTSSACSELLATPPRRASPSSSLLDLLVPISLFEFSLYPRLRALSVSLSLRRLSLIGCGLFAAPSPSFLPRRRVDGGMENEKENIRTSQAILFNNMIY